MTVPNGFWYFPSLVKESSGVDSDLEMKRVTEFTVTNLIILINKYEFNQIYRF